MRKTWVAIAAMSVCLAVSGIPALAQDESEMPRVPVSMVTGTESCTDVGSTPSILTPYGSAYRGAVMECTNTMSDPRVSGEWLNTHDEDCYRGSFCIYQGTHVLDGPEGGWECEWSGTMFPGTGPGILIVGICPGTGGYDGLTYVFQHTTTTFDGESSFRGAIYEGPPPGEPLPAE